MNQVEMSEFIMKGYLLDSDGLLIDCDLLWNFAHAHETPCHSFIWVCLHRLKFLGFRFEFFCEIGSEFF